MPILVDIVQINADDVNVFDTRLGGRIPIWARRVRFQLVYSDYDCLFDCTIADEELARDSSPHINAADNLGSGDWNSPHIMKEIARGATDQEILVAIDEVTAGEGLAIIQFES